MGKSRILIIGVTGNLGFELAKASIAASHPTFGLVRDSAFSNPDKSHKLQTLSNAGATLLKGSLQDEASLIQAIKQVDVVICAISSRQVLDQKLLIPLIKQAGCIKRFIPSEFGSDPDKTRISDLDYNFYSRKAEIRRLALRPLQGTKSQYLETGNVKGVFVKESDVAAFTINTVDDPCTLNKVLYLRPPGNVYSMNELIETWESKIKKKLEKIYVPEEELLKKIKETPYPDNMAFVFIYSAFVKGDQTYFDIKSSGGVDGSQLYPHLKYTTISKYLDTLL
ncbi:hypothetical protein F0562_020564 [Nyssa sinensis]|uniref:NmrA-like domain-containing protein n=1 Tax=Nyssa sinensis TaxID=561372 RepID=A0A5J5BSJ4_9ASTE|nr:hypothetical protein F0562_020564 [Nyssa sinensis]